MHNRARMIAAMYLTKDLMIDWRLGERVSYLLNFYLKSPQTKNPFSRITAFYAAIHRRRSRFEQWWLAMERKHWHGPAAILSHL